MHFPTELLLCQNQGAKCALQVPHGLALLLEGRGAPSTKSWAAERLPSCTSRLPASFRVLGGCLSPKVFLICRESVRLAALMAGIDAAAGAPRLETRAVPEVSARACEWLRGEVTRGRLPAPHWLWIRGLFILLQQFQRHRFPQAKPELGAGAGGCPSRPGVRRHQAWGATQGHREPPHSPPGDQKCNLGLQDSSPLLLLPSSWLSLSTRLASPLSTCI